MLHLHEGTTQSVTTVLHHHQDTQHHRHRNSTEEVFPAEVSSTCFYELNLTIPAAGKVHI